MCCSQRSSLSITMSVWNAQTSAIMLLGFLNISYAWHGNLAGQVAFPVAVSLAKLAAKLLLVLCTAAKAVLEARGCVMCGAFSAYIGRATLQQACCPFACCCTPTQPQTISHMFLGCPVAATVVSWLCRLWQAMTGHTPDASVATILAASTPDGHCASDALLQTWHRLRLAVLHSIWTAARITASSTQGLAPTQASPSPSHSHLASRLALKTITFFFFFFFWRERYSLHKCNDSNLKSM